MTSRWGALGGLCAVLLAVLPSAGCKDSGTAEYAQAKSDYALLVSQGRRPTDPAFDKVVAELRKVPDSSDSYASAQVLLRAIKTGRVKPPPVPLSEQRHSQEPADVMRLRAECEHLAQSLGSVPGQTLEQQRRHLDDCKKQLDALRESHEPPN